ERTNLLPFRPADKLVTAGVYHFTRNPMYLGLALVLVGAWLLLGAVSPTAGLILFILIINHWLIYPEERLLDQKFGTDYENYRGKVRRWI
ncbi:MAG: isoprenylcysteine carboxylmethyltransferase family protein, partial [Desulfobacterales bacterium]|nr:isoprenylcysteine carboxylmethyltransferase family protein [Desulfobacterales bacterium]